MKKTRLLKKTDIQLLEELQAHMEQRNYIQVLYMLKNYPHLIKELTPCCEVPLVMAIKQWDPKLVQICIDRGSNPVERHECSKDSRPKIPMLIAAEELGKRIFADRDHDAVVINIMIYEEIITVMEKKAAFSKGAS